MTTTDSEPGLELARKLIRAQSVTPQDAGCMGLVRAELEPLGFVAKSLPFGEVENLWLRRGEGRPLFCFVGHTDVVPTGPVEHWRYPPFSATVADGCLWGRGAADMKGSVAAMVAALAQFLHETPEPGLSLALLLTSDEEGPAVDGTVRVADYLKQSDQVPDWVLVGEPSSDQRVGDRVRVGRRGSLHCHVCIRGLQGHVAYPDLVRNPIQAAAPLLSALAAENWSRSETQFPPTTLQMTQIHAGTGALNVVPGEVRFHFNLRYSPDLGHAQIRQRVDELVAEHLPASGGFVVELDWEVAAEPYHSGSDGRLCRAICEALQGQFGSTPEISTGGGTSDGRFLAPLGCEVVEMGPLTDTIHQVDEHLPLADFSVLRQAYLATLRRLADSESPARSPGTQ